MAEIVCYLRGTSKTKPKGTVTVRFTHNREHFERATKVRVTAKDFDEGAGRVKNRATGAAGYNDEIEVMRSRFQWALSRVVNDKLDPTAANIRDAYERLLAIREPTLELNQKIAAKHQSVADSLRADITSLKAQLAAKEQQLKQHLESDGENEKLLVKLIERFVEGEREKPLARATIQNYTVLGNLIKRYLPTLRIDEVTDRVLIDLRNTLIKKGLANSSIREKFIQLKAVIKYFAEEYDIDTRFLAKVKVAPGANDKPAIYLNPKELTELELLELPTPRARYVRDLFLLSCFTGLRHVDLHFSEAQIEDNYLQMFGTKTERRFDLPFTEKARAILTRMVESGYNYTPQLVGNYSNEVKAICALIPSFSKPVAISLRKPKPGEKIPTKPKHQFISSKVGRKTFINSCLIKGVRIEVVAEWVGHSNLEMINSHYSNKKAQSDAERHKVEAGF
jgi:integrase